MMNTSAKILKILAVLAWLSGAIILFLKGSEMLHEAQLLQLEPL